MMGELVRALGVIQTRIADAGKDIAPPAGQANDQVREKHRVQPRVGVLRREYVAVAAERSNRCARLAGMPCVLTTVQRPWLPASGRGRGGVDQLPGSSRRLPVEGWREGLASA